MLLPALALTLGQLEPDITAGPPPKAKPSVPGWGFWPDVPKAWKATHEGYVARTRRVATEPIEVVFLGDSITQGWVDPEFGGPVWDRDFAPLHAVNYGIGGDTTRQILWRLGHGTLDGLAPKAVVLMIGTNNLYADGNAGTDEEIADGVEAVVRDLYKRVPKAKVLLLAILPRNDFDIMARVVSVNRLLQGRAHQLHVTFVDPSPAFLAGPGSIRPQLYRVDRIHLSALGYARLAEAIQGPLASLLRS